MKSARSGLGRALDQPDPALRFYLFHGADDAQSRGHGERLLKALGAARFIVPAGTIKSDPALLSAEAGAMSLFGGPRAIWIEPASEDIAAGVAALLDAPATESVVVAIAGPLRNTSELLKLAESHRHAFAHVSYALEGKDAERMVIELGRTRGLRIAPGVAARIADAAGNDQAIVAQELAKLALYLDAMPEAPKDLDHDALDAVGAAMPEGDFLRLADQALAGALAALGDGLGALSPGGGEAIPAIRSLQRRLLMLAPIRARIEAGERPDAVLTSLGKSLFWKDKPLIGQLLTQWDAVGLAKVAERAGKLEREIMLTGAPPGAALGEELVAIGRQARRR